MNIIKCTNGHFYDADKESMCPHCGMPWEYIPAPGKLILLQIDDHNRSSKIELEGFELLTGRDFNVCQILLKNEYTSAKHAKFIYSYGEEVWSIVDIGSTNGTYLNGIKLQNDVSYALKNRDLISFANRENFTFLEVFPNNKVITDFPSTIYSSPDIMRNDDSKEVPCVYASPDIMSGKGIK